MKLYWALLSMTVFCAAAMGKVSNVSSDNVLDNIFHHQGAGAVKDSVASRAKLGEVVLYFKQEPKVTIEHRKDISPDTDQFTFFFPVQKIAADAKALLSQGAVFKTKAYSVALTVLADGVSAVVSFNPKTTTFFYAWFDSIGDKHKGWTFRFFDKKTLQDIGKVNQPVLLTAEAKHSIVIDCGHGGTDNGAHHFNLKEKTIALEIGQQLASLLRHQGYTVFLTRDADVTMPLDMRTSFANRTLADLCISIHANAGGAHAKGIETYYLDEHLLHDSVLYPTNFQCKQALQVLSKDRWQQSMKLAQAIQSNILLSVKKMSSVVDRGVRTAVSQMLMGVTNPTVVVEVGFLSNKTESALLGDATYQRLLAEGLCKGVVEYYST